MALVQQFSDAITKHFQPVAEAFDLKLEKLTNHSFQMTGDRLNIKISFQDSYLYGINISLTSKLKRLKQIQTYRGIHWFVRFFNIQEPIPKKVENLEYLDFISLGYKKTLIKVLNHIANDSGDLWHEFYTFVNRELKIQE